MLPSLNATLMASLIALIVGLTVALAGGRLGRWRWIATLWSGLFVGWIVLCLSNAAMTLIGLTFALTLVLLLVGAARDAFHIPRLVEWLVAALVMVAVMALEYRRGDVYAWPMIVWIINGVFAFLGLTFTGDATVAFGRSASGVTARLMPVFGLYFAVIGFRLPNPGVLALGLLILAASLPGLAALRRSELPSVANHVMVGLLFGTGYLAWLGYASPEMAMAPFVIPVVDAVVTLIRRIVRGRVLAGEGNAAHRIGGVLDPRDDSIFQRTAAARGVPAAERELVVAHLLCLVIALVEWIVRVPALVGAVPFVVVALLYVASPAIRGRRTRQVA